MPLRATARRTSLLAPLFGLTVLLSACGGGSELITPATAIMASGAVIIAEDKTPTDLIASAVTGLDCDTIRKSRDKGPLCRPEKEEVIEAPLYCYRTLGTVNCFERPNPYGYQQRTIN
ncbi:hypothetical protein [Pacificispira sp.]|uniref:hypothetical protein n=1 Tax=Pacificispira sp. TaxID=2888761 RepID=UPI003BA973C6